MLPDPDRLLSLPIGARRGIVAAAGADFTQWAADLLRDDPAWRDALHASHQEWVTAASARQPASTAGRFD